MTNRTYRNYIFDLYGTLVDIHTDEDSPELWRRFADHLQGQGICLAAEITAADPGLPTADAPAPGIAVTDAPAPCSTAPDPARLKAAYRAVCARLQKEAEEKLLRERVPGPAEIDILEVWRALFADRRRAAFGPAGPAEPLTEEDLLQVSRVFRRSSTEKLRLFPGAEELLQQLRARGKQIVLLTNAQSSFTLPELEQLGIGGAFDRIFISGDAGIKKPSPAFFDLLKQNGYLPEESLMIGNDDVCDCRGAAAAGMDSLYIFTEQSPPRSGPLPENCREITRLQQVMEG